MAIFHARVQVIGRSKGRSVVAAAAYRAAQCLQDEKLGLTHDFMAKTGVVHSEIMLPADAPTRWNQGETAKDQHAARATLWNEVEAREKRCDAQLAREMEFAIPRELPRAEAIELARAFVREQFVDRGMVADLNVHWDVGADGQAKPHAHVMLTMRQVTPEGFGPKAREWNSAALYEGVRERWAALANERLAQLGHDVRIDHRSYAEQGIGLEPQHKIGPAGARRAVRGEPAERAAEHVEIARRNGEAILADPNVVLDAITRQHSTFTRADLARFVNRHTADGDQFARAMAVVEASPELVRLGEDGRGWRRLTTREMLTVERRMEQTSLALSRRQTHGVLLERRRAAPAEAGLSDEQRAAFGHLTRSRDLSVLVGIAGGGKTTLLGAARSVWEAEGYRVRGATLSGIAAEGLEAGSGIESRTLASLEWGWNERRDALTARDVLVVDEAGMVGSRQMERVLGQAQAAGAKVVLVGDPEQLQAIEAGAAFRAIAERVGAAEILETQRQHQPWQREATRELATGRTTAALERYEAAGMMHGHGTAADARAALIVGWDRERRAAPEQSRVILAYTRADAQALNQLARERLRVAGELGAEQVVQTERGERRLAAGDRLMFLRNERRLGAGPGGGDGVAVKNGTLGTVLAVEAEGERLTVRLDRAGGGRAAEVTFSVGDYAALEHGYAATTHKGQGVTVDRAHVLASAHMDRHAAYVALSRHRDGVSLHWSAAELGSREGLSRVLRRERAKDTSLDYGDGAEGAEAAALAYAERRGLDPLWPGSAVAVPPKVVQEPPRPEPAPVPAPALAVPGEDAKLEALRVRWAEQRERLAALPPGSVHRMLEQRRAEAALRGALPAVLERMRALGGAMAELARNMERLASGSLARDVAQAVAAARESAAPVAGTGTPSEASEPEKPTLVLTEAERPGLRRALSGMGRIVPEAAPALPGAKADAAPERPEPLKPLKPLKPLLPGAPFRPVEEADVAAAVEDDVRVRSTRSVLTYSLKRAYRDPDQAAKRLVILEQELGSAAAVAAHLAKRPTLLGRLRGNRWLLAVDSAVERHLALNAAGEIGQELVAQRKAEQQAASAYREPIERQRHSEAVEVPGLSLQAWQAAEAMAAAGATVGWQGPAPWDTDPPTADDIARAARVAPVWAAIRAKPGLHDELQRFMAAARQRLPNHDWEPRDDLKGPEQEVQALSGALHAAQALSRCHPGFRAYAAAEPERRAQAARERDAAARAAEQARQAAEEKAQADAKAKAESDARIAAALAHRHRIGPRSSPGMR